MYASRQTAQCVRLKLELFEPTCVQFLHRGNARWLKTTRVWRREVGVWQGLLTPKLTHEGTQMNHFSISALVLALGLVFSTAPMAAGISKDEYKAGKDKIAAEYKVAKSACAPLAGNPKDICMAEAKGKEKVAKAELEDSYKLTRKTLYQARIAKAEADYAVANEKCDDIAGNAKDVCVKEAKAVAATAKADAKLQMKTSAARATANEKSTEARVEANSKTADAIKDATATKLAADYKVAKEKCDDLAGNAKDVCVKEAKTRFGK